MSSAKENIFARLNSAGLPPAPDAPLPPGPDPVKLPQADIVDLFQHLMEAVRTEVHRVAADQWDAKLMEIVQAKSIQSLVYAPETPIGETVERAAAKAKDAPTLVPYVKTVEEFKSDLFEADASITSTLGGIADTGALIVWPSSKEPRLMSLVPHIHIAVVEAQQIYANFSEAMQKLNYAGGMPTNALLISGPSKTADIEFTLAFGVHGPKELVVLILDD
jgi:L-lactate dehydrogenase complex protein LldG